MTTTPPNVESVPDPAEIAAAVAQLGEGAIVGVPTETVYGLAVRADRKDALEQLALTKGAAQGSRTFTWHLAADGGAREDALGTAALAGIAKRLSSRYWPGPLTLVLQSTSDSGGFPGADALANDGWTGLRVPAHATAEALLSAAPFPIAMTSANRAGETPTTSADSARGVFPENQVPLMLPGPESALGSSSTVLAVGPGRFEVLREGIVGKDELLRVAGLSILFVCTGNTCRSPMAEAIARSAIRTALNVADEGTEVSFGYSVASAGVYAGIGAPASENAVITLKDRGIDLSAHGSRPAIDREVAAADRVYCLTRSHRAALLTMLPPGAGEHVELLDPDGGDVPDPFGGPLEVYGVTADAIERFVAARVKDWV